MSQYSLYDTITFEYIQKYSKNNEKCVGTQIDVYKPELENNNLKK